MSKTQIYIYIYIYYRKNIYNVFYFLEETQIVFNKQQIKLYPIILVQKFISEVHSLSLGQNDH